MVVIDEVAQETDKGEPEPAEPEEGDKKPASHLDNELSGPADCEAHALKNYEQFHKLPEGTATIDQVKQSSTGIEGWARQGTDGAPQKGLDKGKNEYQKGNYEEAVKAWARSHQSIRYILDKNLYKDKPDQLKEVYDMEITVCNNMAQGSLKTGDWAKAVEYADMALRIEPNNAKALWRKASAQKALLSYPEAIAVLEKLLQVEPANAAAKALLAEVRQLTRGAIAG